MFGVVKQFCRFRIWSNTPPDPKKNKKNGTEASSDEGML
jgi:hypothetical protein